MRLPVLPAEPRRLIAALAALSIAVSAMADESAFEIKVSDSPPEGFEDLLGANTTMVDVYYTGRLLLTTLATYESDQITFADPAELVSAVSDVIDANVVTEALSGPLSHHADLLCRHAAQVDCGRLDPPVAGVIFDESRFAVELFVNPLQLAVEPVFTTKFLPPPDDGLSSVHGFSLAAAGAVDNQFSVNADSVFAWGGSRVASRLNHASDDGFRLDELSWQRDASPWQYEAGLFRSLSRSIALPGERRMLGARWGSNLDTRADLDVALGTPIQLFLDRASRVDVFREDRLLDSRRYPAGNQQLDTTRLPDGAYFIDLRIRSDDGSVRTERFYFNRTAQLPPADQPLYYAELAKLTDEPAGWLRLGTARRVRENMGLSAELASLDGGTLLEGGVFLFSPGFQLHATATASTIGAWGGSLGVTARKGEFAMGLDLRTWQLDALSSPGELWPEAYIQGILNLGSPLAGGRLFARVQTERRGSNRARNSIGLSWLRSIVRRQGYTVDLQVDAAMETDENWLRIGVDFRRLRPTYDLSIKPATRSVFGGNAGGTEFLLDSRVTRTQHSPRFGQLTSSAYSVVDADRTMLGTRLVSDSPYGYADLELEHTRRSDHSTLGYSANARANLVVGQNGAWAWGGARRNNAALIVDIDAAAGDAVFDVLVDRQPYATARTGRTVVPLTAYEAYDIRLAARGETLVEFDERVHYVVVYPGTVRHLKIAANVIKVVVGRAVQLAGPADGQVTAIADARIVNLRGFATTDTSGWFQVEITDQQVLDFETRDGTTCRIVLPGVIDSLAVLGDLPCLPIPE